MFVLLLNKLGGEQRTFLLFASSLLPSAQNHSYAKVAYLGWQILLLSGTRFCLLLLKQQTSVLVDNIKKEIAFDET